MQTKRLMDKAPLLKERYWSNCHTDEDFELLIFIQRFLSSVSLIFILFFFFKCWHCTSQHSLVWCQVWKLEHTWGAFVQRNKQTWVMLEKHVSLDIVLYCSNLYLILFFILFILSIVVLKRGSCHCGKLIFSYFLF